jgi:molecular chaperone DnaK
LRIINEPTAAALAYGVDRRLNQYLMVYDLGGGTFDVSIIEQQDEIMEVRACHGNVNLGGDDFDDLLQKELLSHLSSGHPYDFKSDRRAMARLNRAAEQAKIKLSDAPYARVTEEFLAQYDGRIVNLNTEVERDGFEALIKDLLESTLRSIDRALEDAGLSAGQIERVLLVGGSTRIPRIHELIREHVGIEPSMEINPDEAVALGAAVQAGIINGEEIDAVLVDVTPHSLGIEIAEVFMGEVVPGNFRPIIRRNTTIPTSKAEKFFTIRPDQDTVDICVYQGESLVSSENKLLGKFRLSGLPPAESANEPREVIVEFTYTLNGIVEVKAHDRHGQTREVMNVNTSSVKRRASLPEQQHHLDPQLENEIERNISEAARLELKLKEGKKKRDSDRVKKARHALEEARDQGDEIGLRKALDKIEELIYDLE